MQGWAEVTFSSSYEFNYAIKSIEIKKTERSYSTIIYYQTVGSRHIQYETAAELNNSTVFAKFKPQEAQIIVSLATIESILDVDQTQILQKYLEYVESCSKNITGRHN